MSPTATVLTALSVLVLVTAFALGSLPQQAIALVVCLVTAGRLLARTGFRRHATGGQW